ncbi:unnamed protein product, partial [Didymodactylos carnosus]
RPSIPNSTLSQDCSDSELLVPSIVMTTTSDTNINFKRPLSDDFDPNFDEDLNNNNSFLSVKLKRPSIEDKLDDSGKTDIISVGIRVPDTSRLSVLNVPENCDSSVCDSEYMVSNHDLTSLSSELSSCSSASCQNVNEIEENNCDNNHTLNSNNKSTELQYKEICYPVDDSDDNL